MGRYRAKPAPAEPPLDPLDALALANLSPEEKQRVKNGHQVGDWVRTARLQAGAKLHPLAERVGCSAAWICTIEAGKSLPNAALLTKIAMALDADPFEANRRLKAELARRAVKRPGRHGLHLNHADRVAYGASQRIQVLRHLATRLLTLGTSSTADDVGSALCLTYATVRGYLDDLVARGDARLIHADHAHRLWTITAQGLARARIDDWEPPLAEAADIWIALTRLLVARDRAETKTREEAEAARARLMARLTPDEIADGTPLPPLPRLHPTLRVTDEPPPDDDARPSS